MLRLIRIRTRLTRRLVVDTCENLWRIATVFRDRFGFEFRTQDTTLLLVAHRLTVTATPSGTPCGRDNVAHHVRPRSLVHERKQRRYLEVLLRCLRCACLPTSRGEEQMLFFSLPNKRLCNQDNDEPLKKVFLSPMCAP